MNHLQNIIDSVVESVKSGKNNGYGPSTGSVEARKAVAKHVSVPGAEIRFVAFPSFYLLVDND